MVTVPRDKLKFIAIAGIVVLFLSGANFGNAQTMEKVDCDALFSTHLVKYGYTARSVQDKKTDTQTCSWRLAELTSATAFAHEDDARIFPISGVKIIIKPSASHEGSLDEVILKTGFETGDERSGFYDVAGGKLKITKDVFDGQPGNYGLNFYAELGRCAIDISGGVGVGNWTATGNTGLEPNYKDFHHLDPDDVTKSINEHPESDHGLGTAKKEMLGTAEQLMADLEPLCSAIATPVTEEKKEETPAQSDEEPRKDNKEPVPFGGYKGCIDRCDLQTGMLKEYCDKRDSQKEKDSCMWYIEYEAGQCAQECYVSYKMPPEISVGGDSTGGQLSTHLPSARETAIDKITQGKSDEFYRKSFDEQNRIIDEYFKENPLSIIKVSDAEGNEFQIDARDIPIVDTMERPLKAVANNDADAISEINKRWVQNEGTFLYNPIFKQYQSLTDIAKQYERYDEFELTPLGISFIGPWNFTFTESNEPIIFPISSGGCCQTITFGTDSQGKPIIDPGMIVTVPEAWQIIKIQDTAAAVGPNSHIELTGSNSVRLSRGTVQIQRPDNATSSFIVETPLGSVTSKKTRFWVAYNAMRGYTLVGVWSGAVLMTNAYTGEVTTLAATGEGTPNIALLLQPEFEEKNRSIWWWIFMVAIASSVGYLVYRYRGKLPFLASHNKTPQ